MSEYADVASFLQVPHRTDRRGWFKETKIHFVVERTAPRSTNGKLVGGVALCGRTGTLASVWDATPERVASWAERPGMYDVCAACARKHVA